MRTQDRARAQDQPKHISRKGNRRRGHSTHSIQKPGSPGTIEAHTRNGDRVFRTSKTVKQVGFDPIRAHGLECFVNLQNTRDAIDSFEKKFNGFFPRGFFTWLTPSIQPQKPNRRVPKPTLTPFWIAYRTLLNRAWRSGFPRKHTTELLNIEEPEGDPESIFWRLPSMQIDHKMEFQRILDFQLAIASLAQANWRAKLCKRCRTPFVADKAGRRFCNRKEGCYGPHRRAAQRNLDHATNI